MSATADPPHRPLSSRRRRASEAKANEPAGEGAAGAKASSRANVRKASQDIPVLSDRQRRAQLKSGREWGQAIRLFLTVNLGLVATLTMAMGRWSMGDTSATVAQTVSVPDTGLVTTVYYDRRVEFGLFEVCNCTAPSETSYFCSAERGLMTGTAAASAFHLLGQWVGIMIFVLTSCIWDNKKWLEWVHVGALGVAFVAAVISWILPIALFSGGPQCSGETVASPSQQSTYRALGTYSLQWCFGFRVVESIGLLVLIALGVLRATERHRVWHPFFLGSIAVLVFSVVSTSQQYWIGPKTVTYNGEYNAVVSHFGACDCASVTGKCPDLASSYRAVAAMAIIRLVGLLLQVIWAAYVPSVLALPPVIFLGLNWVTWVVFLCTWGIAIATFASCGCGGINSGQSLDWPFAFDFLAFLGQTALAGHTTYQFVRTRLHDWALQQVATELGLGDPAGKASDGDGFDSDGFESAASSRAATPRGSRRGDVDAEGLPVVDPYGDDSLPPQPAAATAASPAASPNGRFSTDRGGGPSPGFAPTSQMKRSDVERRRAASP